MEYVRISLRASDPIGKVIGVFEKVSEERVVFLCPRNFTVLLDVAALKKITGAAQEAGKKITFVIAQKFVRDALKSRGFQVFAKCPAEFADGETKELLEFFDHVLPQKNEFESPQVEHLSQQKNRDLPKFSFRRIEQSHSQKSVRGKVFFGFLGAIALLGWGGGMSRAQMSPYKALSRARLMPGIEVLLEHSDPLGVLTIIRGPTLRSAAGLSFAYQGDIRPQPAAYLDGNPLGPLPLLDDPSTTDALRHACFALPYRIRSFTASRDAPRRVLVLNAGPGIDVQHALVEGAGSVTAVERHRGLIHALGRLADGEVGPPTVYHHPQVEVVVAEPRHFLYGDTTHYDVVVLPPMGGVISTSTGMDGTASFRLSPCESMSALTRPHSVPATKISPTLRVPR